MLNKKSLAIETFLRLVIVAVGLIVIIPIAKNFLGPIAKEIFGGDDEKKSFGALIQDIYNLEDGQGITTKVVLEEKHALIGINAGSSEFRCTGCHGGTGSSSSKFARIAEYGCPIDKSCICRCEGISEKSAGDGIYDLACARTVCKPIEFTILSPFKLGSFTWENGFFYVGPSTDEVMPFNGIGSISSPNYK